jgi:hypothetical protein
MVTSCQFKNWGAGTIAGNAGGAMGGKVAGVTLIGLMGRGWVDSAVGWRWASTDAMTFTFVAALGPDLSSMISS